MIDDLLSAEDLQFRAQVRDFLGRCFTPELRERSEIQTGVFADPHTARQWHTVLYRQGWAAPGWPVKYGGTGWTPLQRYLFDLECARAGTPLLPVMGQELCAPVIMEFGTDEQREFFLPRMLSGEHIWCQGYSEPQSGSDLASLQTRATRDHDHYVINGSKIWTTHAHAANWIFVLVRTGADCARPQDGISFVVLPLNLPGVTVRPIRSLSGEHELNQVFFDDVRVPVGNRIGAENEGWRVAKFLLEKERGGTPYAPRLYRVRQLLSDVLAAAPEADEHRSAERLIWLDIDLLAFECMELRALGGDHLSLTAATASVKKVVSSELSQRIEEQAVELLCGWATESHADRLYGDDEVVAAVPRSRLTGVARYWNGRASTIFGGTNEIQRNIIAKLIFAAGGSR